MSDYDGPERRRPSGPSWRDFTDALNELRQEVRHDTAEVRNAAGKNTDDLRREVADLRSHVGERFDKVNDDLEEGFARTDRRIIAAAVAITALLSLAITIATSLMT